MINRLPSAAIGVTTTLFTITFSVIENYALAAACLLLGAIWLLLEYHRKTAFTSLFFVVFIGLAAAGSVNREPSWLMVLGIAADLAAWDLSRFLDRLRNFAAQDVSPELYTKHLYRLAVPLCVGFGLALVPMFIQLPVSFVAFLVLALLAVILFRKAALGLPGEARRPDRL